ncbi:MAG: anthranilate phosphoribosyltransferase [Myxococcota bacterium]|nr:anthranilate phosphoribosyltransferase [Myxococcota bacterium]
MSVREAIARVTEKKEVSEKVLEAAFAEIMAGEATPAQVAALLVGMRMKGETVTEIVAVAKALRAAATTATVPFSNVVDTCGTGGSGQSTFSISTTSAFVVAGAGVPVAKHGNRAASSQTGSFDTLEALGVGIDLSIERCAAILEKVGIAPFFARTAHPAFRHVGPVRSEIGVRTLLNCLGPLLNPVGARNQIVGVFSRALVEPLAEALGILGADRALVVHGSDGLDEITTTGPTHAALAEAGGVEVVEIDPLEFGVPRATAEDLSGGDAAENAEILRAVLSGASGPRRDIVCLNAAGALWAARAATGIGQGLEMAAKSIDSGAAAGKLDALIDATRGMD